LAKKNSLFLMTNIKNILAKQLGLTALALFFSFLGHAQNDVVTLIYDNTRVRDLTFTADGKHLIAKSGDDVITNNRGTITSPCIHVWDLETKRNTARFAEKDMGRASCISNDGNIIAFKEKSNIIVMDIPTRKIISTIKFSDNKLARPISIVNENKGLVIEQNNLSLVYDISGETGKFEREYASNGSTHYFSSNDVHVIDGFVDNFKLIEFKSGKELNAFECGKEELKTVVFSPENRFVAILSDNKVRLWDMQSYKMAHTLPIGQKDNIFCISSDGRYVIGGNDTLKIWELKTRKEIKTHIGFESRITAAAISPDGRYLICGDSKGFMKLWNFTDENMAAQYFSREIENEDELIPGQKEFEKTADFNKRKQKLKRSIRNKYLSQYIEKISTEKTIQEQWAEEDELREEGRKQQILASRQFINFKVDSISTYNADKETFQVKIVNEEERYSRWETVKIPIREGAQCFKQRYQNHTITGTKQLTDDLKTYEIFNVKIKSNCSGKDKDYTFGSQKRASDE
jgi:WD40 repeat protein